MSNLTGYYGHQYVFGPHLTINPRPNLQTIYDVINTLTCLVFDSLARQPANECGPMMKKNRFLKAAALLCPLAVPKSAIGGQASQAGVVIHAPHAVLPFSKLN